MTAWRCILLAKATEYTRLQQEENSVVKSSTVNNHDN